jgi:hypothetical protein
MKVSVCVPIEILRAKVEQQQQQQQQYRRKENKKNSKVNIWTAIEMDNLFYF